MKLIGENGVHLNSSLEKLMHSRVENEYAIVIRDGSSNEQLKKFGAFYSEYFLLMSLARAIAFPYQFSLLSKIMTTYPPSSQTMFDQQELFAIGNALKIIKARIPNSVYRTLKTKMDNAYFQIMKELDF
jgi:hypothetical protein